MSKREMSEYNRGYDTEWYPSPKTRKEDTNDDVSDKSTPNESWYRRDPSNFYRHEDVFARKMPIYQSHRRSNAGPIPDTRDSEEDSYHSPKRRTQLILILTVVGVTLLVAVAIIVAVMLANSGDPPSIVQGKVTGKITNKNYSPLYNDTSSPEFLDLQKELCSEVGFTLETKYDTVGYQGCTLVSVRNGSLIVVLIFQFKGMSASAVSTSISNMFRPSGSPETVTVESFIFQVSSVDVVVIALKESEAGQPAVEPVNELPSTSLTTTTITISTQDVSTMSSEKESTSSITISSTPPASFETTSVDEESSVSTFSESSADTEESTSMTIMSESKVTPETTPAVSSDITQATSSDFEEMSTSVNSVMSESTDVLQPTSTRTDSMTSSANEDVSISTSTLDLQSSSQAAEEMSSSLTKEGRSSQSIIASSVSIVHVESSSSIMDIQSSDSIMNMQSTEELTDSSTLHATTSLEISSLSAMETELTTSTSSSLDMESVSSSTVIESSSTMFDDKMSTTKDEEPSTTSIETHSKSKIVDLSSTKPDVESSYSTISSTDMQPTSTMTDSSTSLIMGAESTSFLSAVDTQSSHTLSEMTTSDEAIVSDYISSLELMEITSSLMTGSIFSTQIQSSILVTEGLVTSEQVSLIEPSRLLTSEHVSFVEPSSVVTSEHVSLMEPSSLVASEHVSLMEPSSVVTSKYVSLMEPSSVVTSKYVSLMEPSSLVASEHVSLMEPSSLVTSKYVSLMEPSSVVTSKYVSLMEPSSLVTSEEYSMVEPSSVATSKYVSLMEPSSVATSKYVSLMEPSSVATSKYVSMMEPSSVVTSEHVSLIEPSRLLTSEHVSFVEPSSVATSKYVSLMEPSSVVTSKYVSLMEPSRVVTSEQVSLMEPSSVVTSEHFSLMKPSSLVTSEHDTLMDESSLVTSGQVSLMDESSLVTSEQISLIESKLVTSEQASFMDTSSLVTRKQVSLIETSGLVRSEQVSLMDESSLVTSEQVSLMDESSLVTSEQGTLMESSSNTLALMTSSEMISDFISITGSEFSTMQSVDQMTPTISILYSDVSDLSSSTRSHLSSEYHQTTMDASTLDIKSTIEPSSTSEYASSSVLLPVFALSMDDVIGVENKTTTLECRLEGKLTLNSVKFLKDEEELKGTIKQNDEKTNFQYTLPSPTCTDSGIYHCMVEGQEANLTATANITIQVPVGKPSLTVPYEIVELRFKETTQFVCTYKEGIPAAQVRWTATSESGQVLKIASKNFTEENQTDECAIKATSQFFFGFTLDYNASSVCCEVQQGNITYSACETIYIIEKDFCVNETVQYHKHPYTNRRYLKCVNEDVLVSIAQCAEGQCIDLDTVTCGICDSIEPPDQFSCVGRKNEYIPRETTYPDNCGDYYWCVNGVKNLQSCAGKSVLINDTSNASNGVICTSDFEESYCADKGGGQGITTGSMETQTTVAPSKCECGTKEYIPSESTYPDNCGTYVRCVNGIKYDQPCPVGYFVHFEIYEKQVTCIGIEGDSYCSKVNASIIEDC